MVIVISALINKFHNKISNLSYSEKHIFYYIDSNLSTAKNQSLTYMAEFNNVSTTTIIRMCSKLGLSGFSELKHVLRSLDENSNYDESSDNVSKVKSGLVETIKNLDMENINKLAKHISFAKRVILISVGLTKPIGEYFAKLLMQSNKNCIYVYESHMIDLLNKNSNKDDLIIFISNSGETKTLIHACEKLSHMNLNISSIVNSPDSTLSRLVDIPINLFSEKINLAGYDITPRSTLMSVVDIIFTSYQFSNK